MGISKLILDTGDRLSPLLVKMIPIEVLGTVKKKILHRNTIKLGKVELAPYDKSLYSRGINLIGNIKGDSGLGQSCRLLANVLENSGQPVCMVQHSISAKLSTLDRTYDSKLETKGRYGINVFHMNPHELATAFFQLGRENWDKHYNIAYWLWELEDFPDEWVNCINLLDEIWTPAEFISESIRKKTDKTVVTVPYYVTAPVNDEYNRVYFGLPDDKFLFLMIFDCGSMMERKNPRAVIEAFMKAFDKQEQKVGLVIKMNGGDPEDVAFIKSCFDGYDNIYLIHKVYSKLEVNSLIKCVDVVVSLHRAEGFGLVMAEAMLNGVPSIATNWSANTEFMSSEVACMVDYELIEIDNDIGPYKKGNRWAEPDMEQAAEYMRLLYEDHEFADSLALRAKEHIQQVLGMEQAIFRIQERIRKIYKE